VWLSILVRDGRSIVERTTPKRIILSPEWTSVPHPTLLQDGQRARQLPIMSSPSMSSPLYTVPPGHLLLHLSSGKTAAFSLPSNPAASFYLYIPTSHPVSRRKRGEDFDPNPSDTKVIYPLVVCVHGSARDAQGVRDRWADTAEREGFVVLCPLFPVDMEVSYSKFCRTVMTC
jgi:hypothetical protein